LFCGAPGEVHRRLSCADPIARPTGPAYREKSKKNKLLFLFQSCLEIWAASSDMGGLSTSGQVDPEIQPKSRPREDCNPQRAVGMRNCSTALPIGRGR
jgi:hypothetical protein